MTNFFDILKSFYRKDGNLPEENNTQLCITWTKWLAFHHPNTQYLREVIPYIFYLEPESYFILLYCSIPKQYSVPFVKKPTIKEKKENSLLNKVQYILGWSNRDIEVNLPILEKTILQNEKYWKAELGVK